MVDHPSLLTFDEGLHAYTLAGRPTRSVTQLLRKVGLVNFDHVPPSVMAPALARGTAVHKAVHFYNEHDLNVRTFTKDYPEYAGYLQSWISLMESGRLQTFMCERRVGNFSPRYCGTFDWLGCVDGQAAIIDYATGHPTDACKHLQTAGYVLAARAWSSLPGEERLKEFLDAHPYVRRYAVRLDRRGGLPQLHPYSDPRDLTKFLTIATAVNIVDDEKPQSVPWDWDRDSFSSEGA